MRILKPLLLAFVLIVSLSWLSHRLLSTAKSPQSAKKKQTATSVNPAPHLLTKAAEARAFVKKHHYNEEVCFLLEMNLPSGQNRFFVFDLKGDSIRRAGLVGHGNCYQWWLEGRRYDNTVGCGCTSLGKYKIGYSYTGRFGYSYKLYGLDSTNSNAFVRTVVLHSHTCVPSSPVNDEICQSNGCPMVAPSFLEYLKPLINKSAKPVLLWIFE